MEDAGSRKRKQPTRPPFARLVAADELGLLKVVEVPAGPHWEASAVVQRWGQPDKSKSIQALAAPDFSRSDADVLALSRAGGSIELLSSVDGSPLCSISAAPPPQQQNGSSKPDTTVKCLAFKHTEQGSLQLVSCATSGMLRVHAQSGSPQEDWEQLAATRTAPNVACMALDAAESRVALGGDGCHLQVWDLSGEGGSPQEVFRAKGGKPNKVGLVDLPNLSAATFVPGDNGGNVVLVGTVQHKLWLYDCRAGKRPQQEIEWGKARVTALAAQHDGARVWAANGSGLIEGLDLKAGKMCGGAMKGPTGSIRALALHPAHLTRVSGSDEEDGEGDAGGRNASGVDCSMLLASAGLDRFARIHSTHSRAVLAKSYLKQQLTGVAWLRVPPGAAGTAGGEGEEDGEEGAREAAGGERQGSKGGSREERKGSGGRSKGGSSGQGKKAAKSA